MIWNDFWQLCDSDLFTTAALLLVQTQPFCTRLLWSALNLFYVCFPSSFSPPPPPLKRHGAFVWSERGAMGPSAFQSSEGLRSDSEGKSYNMNSSQHALLSSPQMCVSTGTFSTQSSSDHGNSYSGNDKMARIPA